MSPERLRIRTDQLIPLVLVLATLAVYWPVHHHPFINFDDPNYITENRHVQGGISGANLEWAFFNLHGEHSYYHPVTWVSHMLDCQLFGLNPGAHHLVNVAFHIANTLLLLLVLRQMTGAFWRSAMVVGLFALHPLQVDTVAWVTERKNVLSTFFFFLTLWAYVRYVGKAVISDQSSLLGDQGVGASAAGENRQNANHRSLITDHRLLFYLLSLFFFVCGLMSKPALVTLPFVLLLLDYWPLRRFEVQSPKPKVQSQPSVECSTSAADSTATLHAPRSTLHGLVAEKLPFLILAAAAAAITVLGHHELRATENLPWSWRSANALVSYNRYVGKALWPTHLAVFYPHPGTWPAGAVAGSALALLLVSAWVVWRVRRQPYLFTGWLWFLGVLVPMIGLIQAGGQAMADRFAYVPLIGLFIMPVWGLADWAAGRPQRCLALKALGIIALGACIALTCRQLSFWRNTSTLFEHALNVTRNNACAHYSLGYELADAGKIKEAIEEWETALRIEPGLADIHAKIASTLCQQGDFTGAIARYRRALEIDPDLVEALNNLAWLLATCPDASLRSGPDAVPFALRACQLTRFRRTIMVGTLAAAYAEAGQFTEAIATAQKACALATAESDQTLLARNQQLLELYRAGKPYHEAR
jgi:protein O-mannosyl-transferase